MAEEACREPLRKKQEYVFEKYIEENIERKFLKEDDEELSKFVGEFLFGLPPFGYRPEQLETISKLVTKIRRSGDCKDAKGNWTNSSDTFVAVIAIFMKSSVEGSNDPVFTGVPVFRIRNASKDYKSSHVFVDEKGRIYDGWKDYLSNNELPATFCSYPEDGVYCTDENGVLLLGFGDTPSNSSCNTALSIIDGVASIARNMAVFAYTEGLFDGIYMCPLTPVFLPAGAVGLAWYVGREAYTLYDRNAHGQSNSLGDAEGREHWWNILTGFCTMLKIRLSTVRHFWESVCKCFKSVCKYCKSLASKVQLVARKVGTALNVFFSRWF